MGQQLFANNVIMTLAGNLAAADTSFTVKSGDGAQCPAIAATDENWFLLTIINKDNAREIIKIIEHVSGSDTFTIGSSAAVPHTAAVAGRAYEAINGVQTALAITAADDHSIRLNITAGTVEDAMAFASVASTVAELDTLHLSGVTNADLIALHAATATPTASTIAKFNSDGIMKSAELNMTDEASATSNDATTTLDLGTVTAGDRIFVSARAQITVGTGTPIAAISVSKSSGTATVIFNHDKTSMLNYLGNYEPSSTLYLHISGIAKVTVGGTLVLGNTATYTGGVVYFNQIYAFFLKKA